MLLKFGKYLVTAEKTDIAYRILPAVNQYFGSGTFEIQKNSKIGLCNYVRKHVIFHLKAVPSKNIEK